MGHSPVRIEKFIAPSVDSILDKLLIPGTDIFEDFIPNFYFAVVIV